MKNIDILTPSDIELKIKNLIAIKDLMNPQNYDHEMEILEQAIVYCKIIEHEKKMFKTQQELSKKNIRNSAKLRAIIDILKEKYPAIDLSGYDLSW